MKNTGVKLILCYLLIVLLVGCTNKEQKAIQTAQGFAIEWQNQDFHSLYNYFTDDLKRMRNEENFIKFVIASDPTDFKIIYDKVVIQNKKEAYAYYTFSGSYLLQSKTPAFHMIFENGNWKMDAFASFFLDDCATLSPCQTIDRQSNLNGECFTIFCSNETNYKCEIRQTEKVPDCCWNDYEDRNEEWLIDLFRKTNLSMALLTCPKEKPNCVDNKCIK